MYFQITAMCNIFYLGTFHYLSEGPCKPALLMNTKTLRSQKLQKWSVQLYGFIFSDFRGPCETLCLSTAWIIFFRLNILITSVTPKHPTVPPSVHKENCIWVTGLKAEPNWLLERKREFRANAFGPVSVHVVLRHETFTLVQHLISCAVLSKVVNQSSDTIHWLQMHCCIL